MTITGMGDAIMPVKKTRQRRASTIDKEVFDILDRDPNMCSAPAPGSSTAHGPWTSSATLGPTRSATESVDHNLASELAAIGIDLGLDEDQLDGVPEDFIEDVAAEIVDAETMHELQAQNPDGSSMAWGGFPLRRIHIDTGKVYRGMSLEAMLILT